MGRGDENGYDGNGAEEYRRQMGPFRPRQLAAAAMIGPASAPCGSRMPYFLIFDLVRAE